MEIDHAVYVPSSPGGTEAKKRDRILVMILVSSGLGQSLISYPATLLRRSGQTELYITVLE
jgi:hypothetical protein